MQMNGEAFLHRSLAYCPESSGVINAIFIYRDTVIMAGNVLNIIIIVFKVLLQNNKHC